MRTSQRCVRFLFLLITVLMVSCVSFAQCSSPNPSNIILTWEPDALVQVNNAGVPSSSLGTALSNWNQALLSNFCNSPSLSTFSAPTATANISYVSSIPTSCTNNNEVDLLDLTTAQIARGCTDLNHRSSDINGRTASVNIYINSQVNVSAAVTEVVAHEFGHTLGLGDCFISNCPFGSSVMLSMANNTNHVTVPSINSTIGQPAPTNCDLNVLGSVATDYLCTNGGDSGCDDPTSCCLGGSGGGSQIAHGANPDDDAPVCSPIILDTEGEGFHLTSAAAGVSFDISGTGHPVQIAWTDERYHNAFLALPGPDGLVHNGKQLFGNFTPQPPSAKPNGFIALAQYDKPQNGGNGDGVIDDKDQVFSRLRLWIDENHDGICQPNELHALSEFGINSIALNYVESRRSDQFGNQFRYKAQVNPDHADDFRDERKHGNEVGRSTYDVFFVAK